MKDVRTVTLQAYGTLNLTQGQTFAYINGNAPYVYLRCGSDSIRVMEGHCVPVDKDFVQLQNPFPRQIELLIGRGGAEQYGAYSRTYTDEQLALIYASHARLVLSTAQTAGTRWGVGLLMKRGSAAVSFQDNAASIDSQVIVFSGASPAFMAAKPAGAFNSAVTFRKTNFEPDDSFIQIAGEYLPADITTWVTAANYTGITYQGQHFNGRRYVVTETDALFFSRYNTSGFDVNIQLYHQGANLGEFD